MTDKDAPEGFKTFEYGGQTRYRCKTCRNEWDTYDKDDAVNHLATEAHAEWSKPKGTK